MLREDAISIMKVIVHMLEEKYDTDRVEEAIDMAIEALSAEPCEDCISRKEVCNYIAEFVNHEYATDREHEMVEHIIGGIQHLPSIQPKPKTGHWITQWNFVHQKEYYYCSECREEFSYDGETGIKMNDYNFCPDCGAKMAESEDKE